MSRGRQRQNSVVTSRLKRTDQTTASDQTMKGQSQTSAQQSLLPVGQLLYVPPTLMGQLVELARHYVVVGSIHEDWHPST